MKVFGVGCMKTGTTTLGECLQILGYRHQSYDLAVVRQWIAGNTSPAFDLLDRFDSFEDWPFPLMYCEAAERYPDAKFILTIRKSPEAWLASMKSHTMRTSYYVRHIHKHFFGAAYPHGNEQAYLDFYNRHNKAVQDHLGDRCVTLCWETGDGWRELCEWLGRPVPDVPFPHSNPSRVIPRNYVRNLFFRVIS
jgi:hypothetical protein